VAGLGSEMPSSASFRSTIPAMIPVLLRALTFMRGEIVSLPRTPLYASARDALRLHSANRVPVLAVMAQARRFFTAPARAGTMLAAPAALAVVLAFAPFEHPHATALQASPEFASHRAVYELSLALSHGNSSAVSARGRILYDFS